MEKHINVFFPGGKRVDATINGMTVYTDQYPEQGGEGSAPEPFELFLASLGTCAGVYALDFCITRGISTDEMSISMKCSFDDATHRCEKVELDLAVAPDFPEHYRNAVIRSMDLCSVKKHIVNPPVMELKTSRLIPK